MLSVVIATKDADRLLVPTLAALVPGALAGTVREVILADAGSSDQTAEIGDIAGCTVLRLPGSLGARLHAAAAAARGEWLMFLRPGLVLDDAWTGEATRFLQSAALDRTDRAAIFRPPTRAGSRAGAFAEAMRLLRAAMASAHPDQGLIISRRFYDALGGHASDRRQPEAEFLRRIGRRRMMMLRCGMTRVRAPF